MAAKPRGRAPGAREEATGNAATALGMSQGFVAWIIACGWRSDKLGHLGRRLAKDECLPSRIRSAEGLLKHLRDVHGEDWGRTVATAAREWIGRGESQ